MTSQDDINLQPKPAPKLVFEKAGQNFSLIAPEVFEFGPPVEKNPKIDRSKINEQIDDLNDFKNKNDLKKYMDKWKDMTQKKDIRDKLKDKFNNLIKNQKDKE